MLIDFTKGKQNPEYEVDYMHVHAMGRNLDSIAQARGGGVMTKRRCRLSYMSRVALSRFFLAILMSEPRSGEPMLNAI